MVDFPFFRLIDWLTACLSLLITLHFDFSAKDILESEETESTIADDTVEPINVTKELKDQEVIEGDSVCFELKAAGSPMPTALWYINEKLIVESPRIKIEADDASGVYSMKIDPVEIKDEGEVKCMLRNKAGRVAVIAELLVDDGK